MRHVQDFTKWLNESTQRTITEIIEETIPDFIGIACNGLPNRNVEDINNGCCQEFSEEVLVKMEAQGDRGIDILHTTMFCDADGYERETFEEDGRQWPVAYDMFKEYGSPIPRGVTDEQILDAVVGHAWMYYKGKHYDAEIPKGVTSIFDIPTIKRGLQKARGSST